MRSIDSSFLTLVLLLFLHLSCSDDKLPEQPEGDFARGYFITNEGPFQNGTGTITHVAEDGSASQEVYRRVNGEDLGNIVNSMFVHEDKAYIVVNNSSRIVVVDKDSMEKTGVIEGSDIDNPRHFIVSRGMGYVSNWGDPFDPNDDFIAVVDLENNTVLQKIGVGEGPERMVSTSRGLFVVLQGGFGFNNEVVLINTEVNEVESTILVGDVPNSLVADASGDIWVLCGGVPAWTGSETPGSLHRIDADDLDTSFLEFGPAEHPGLMNFDQGQLYYNLDGKVYRMTPGSMELPEQAIAGLDGFYYGMTVRNGELYGTDPGDFASEGSVKIYSVGSGTLISTVEAGIVPGNVVIP